MRLVLLAALLGGAWLIVGVGCGIEAVDYSQYNIGCRGNGDCPTNYACAGNVCRSGSDAPAGSGAQGGDDGSGDNDGGVPDDGGGAGGFNLDDFGKPGTLGGECRPGNQCNPGLECVDEQCTYGFGGGGT